jgi:tetratricopeptide (TPR) repeat protein
MACLGKKLIYGQRKTYTKTQIGGGTMSNYVWSTKDKSGQKVIKEIEAETAEDAKFILLAQGYSDLELKEDEVGSAAIAGFPKTVKAFGEEIKVTAEERLKHRDNPTVTFWDALRKGIGQSLIGCLLLILLAIHSGYRENWGSALLYIVGLLAWLAFIICVSLPSVYYRKLIKAADWSQWSEVLSLVATLETMGRFSFVKVPATELTRNRTKALAGMGRLDEALAEYKQCEGRPDCPSWLHKLFVASLYTTAKQYDKAIEFNLASIAEKPTSTAWADLANRYARYKRDPAKAGEAMAEAEKSPMADIAKPFCIRCRGIIAYLEGDLATARRELETAIELVEKAKSRPYRDGHLSVARAYLCCVLAKQGDLPMAKKCFNSARDYLVATKEDELLAECRQLTGER